MGLILLLVVLVLLFGGGGFYLGPPFHYYGGGPRHDINNRYYSPSVEGLTRLLARYERPPQLAASSFPASGSTKISVLAGFYP